MRKIILKATAIIMVIVCMFFGSALDSHSWIPYIGFIVSGGWLAMFGYANKIFDWQVHAE